MLSSDSGYAHRRKELLALVNKLRASGAQADLDLPRIAVIGNQSAGKSSLVEAISGITVPRDAGTCTRCPMECRMRATNELWRCQVSIRWEFDGEGNQMNKVEEISFGDTMKDKSEVELMLRRAQAAVLYPEIPAKNFVTMSLEDLHRFKISKYTPLPFSRNAVCIDLEGPELTDLSFIDLPGIIQNADPQVVQLVEDLVTLHIRGNCLILLTLPMSDDIDNQKAARLARDVDPAGARTIGVLTKPDTLPSGSVKLRELWLEVLEGRSSSNQLMHGYFCTRQPDDAERAAGINSAQARHAEAEFFAKQSPWNKSSHKHRFGTPNLVDTLSKLLTERIDETLPGLQKEVVAQLMKCRTELSALPPSITGEPSVYVLNLVTEFCRDVRDYVQGGTSAAELVQRNRQIYTTFKYTIRSTAPRFIPYPSARETQSDALDYLKVDMEDDEESDPALRADKSTIPPNPAPGDFMYLDDVKSFINKALTRELPNNVPYTVKVQLIIRFQKSWQQQSSRCFDRVYSEFETLLTGLMDRKFKRYGNLHSRIRLIIQELLKMRREATLTQLGILTQLETTPYTQNSHYLAEKTDKCLAIYKDARAGKGKAQHLSEFPKQLASTTQGAQSAGNVFGQSTLAPSKTSPFSFSSNASVSGSAGIPSMQADAPSPFAKVMPKRAEDLAASSSGSLLSLSSGTNGAKAPGGPKSQAPSASNPPLAMNNNIFTLGLTGANESTQPSSITGKANTTQDQQNEFAAKMARESRAKDVQEALASLAKLGYYISEDDLGRLNPPDIYEEELQVMAEVRAYFHVAYKRIIDYVPLSIDHLFLYGLAETLQQFLIEKLGLGSPKATERCAAYLAEDANIVAVRKELMGKKERLESVQIELENFGL